MTVFLFTAQGADNRLFDKTIFTEEIDHVYIKYHSPGKKTTMKEFAQSLIPQIDTESDFILVGVSLGGMICSELAEILNPKKTIIISSAKCRSELPAYFRIFKYLPIQKLIPNSIFRLFAQIVLPIVEPESKGTIIQKMLKEKDSFFLKRTSDMIVSWDRSDFSKDIIHIHGTNDSTLPIRNIKADITIQGGSHMMIYSKAEEINRILNEYIKKSILKFKSFYIIGLLLNNDLLCI